MGESSPSEVEFRFHTVGEQLKAARERLGLTLSDLAAKTRVPTRHLEAIEKSEFGTLPGSTYTLGFARSYARAVDMDAAKVSSELRAELAQSGHEGYQAPAQNYEPADPARVPSRTLAWTAAAIGVLVVLTYFVWRSMTLGDTDITAPAAPVAQSTKAATSAVSPDNADADSPVVITATGNVWVKIYDAENNRLYENEMKAGDSFIVPENARKPMIVTGRPQALDITVGGKAVPTLGTADQTIADVEVSANALLARLNPTPATSASVTGASITGKNAN